MYDYFSFHNFTHMSVIDFAAVSFKDMHSRVGSVVELLSTSTKVYSSFLDSASYWGPVL